MNALGLKFFTNDGDAAQLTANQNEVPVYRQEILKVKAFRVSPGKLTEQGGFSLAEATFSIGLLSLGLLSLAPSLALGLKSARFARNDQTSAAIAETVIEEGRQGTLTLGTATSYFDESGAPLSSAQNAAFVVQSSSQATAQNPALTQMTLRVTPTGAPDRMRAYAIIYPTSAVTP